jgi:isocitrate/isopropylmalate dehydrogenase
VRLMPGVPTPLANRTPGDIDFWVVRENTEGEYSATHPHCLGDNFLVIRAFQFLSRA